MSFLSFLRERVELQERDIKDVIGKLIILSLRPGSPAEGETALAQAKSLAAKYKIDLDDIRNQVTNASTSRIRSTSTVHPADKLFSDISILAKQVPGMRFDGRVSRTPFASSCAQWSLRHDGAAVIVFLPMQGEKEHPTMWYLVAGNMSMMRGYNMEDFVMSKGTNAADLLDAIRSVDWAGVKKKQEQARAEEDSAAMNTAQQLTPEASAVVNVATKLGYTLGKGEVGRSYRIMMSEPYRLTVYADGSWYHETRQGDVGTNKWKQDTKAFDKKNVGPASLEKWIKTKRRTGEAAFSVHDDINAIAKLLLQYGFKPDDKQGNLNVWSNRVVGYNVRFGPNKMSGALKKTDDIFWMLASNFTKTATGQGYMHDLKAQFGKSTLGGKTVEELEKILSQIMSKAQIGFDKIILVVHQFGFNPDPKIVSHPEPHFEYFSSKSKRYYLVVSPKTGAWKLYKKWEGSSDIMLEHGTTAEELEQRLNKIKSRPNNPLDRDTD